MLSSQALITGAAAQGQHQVQHGPASYRVVLRTLVVAPASATVHLLAAEYQALLHGRDALLLLDLLLDLRDKVRGLNVDLDLLAGERLDLDLHETFQWAAIPAIPAVPAVPAAALQRLGCIHGLQISVLVLIGGWTNTR